MTKNIEIDEDPWQNRAAESQAAASVNEPGEDEDDLLDAWNPDRPITSTITAFLGAGMGIMPVRWLPHTDLTSLFWLMQAHCDLDPSQRLSSEDVPVSQNVLVSQHPSWSVFYRVWTSTWKEHLKLRKYSMHAQCRTCFEAQERMRAHSTTLAQRLDYARQWRRHLRDQYHDRAIYWFNRYASRRYLGVLTVIIDSMDKAKFAWPQYPWKQVDKDLEHHRRPRFVFTAAMAHGYGTFFFIADEHVSHGASAFCEVLLRVVEAVWDKCRSSGISFPQHLIVQSDNTVAQAKNSLVNLFLAFLVSKYKFQTANLFFLVVGHTHEDIDQLFGVVLSLVLRKVAFRTSRHLIDSLHAILEPRVVAKGEALYVTELTHIRDFVAWLEPAGVKLHNGFGTRYGVESPHAFMYKLRRDLTKQEQSMIQPTSLCAHGGPFDVFCCVKTYMHSPHLQDPPLMVLPTERAKQVQVRHPTTYIPIQTFSRQRAEELRALAKLLRREPSAMPDAAEALEAMLGPHPEPPLPASPWLDEDAARPVDLLAETGNTLFPHLPDSSWQLLVRFKPQPQG